MSFADIAPKGARSLFPSTLIEAIRDGRAADRRTVLALARHSRRDLAATYPTRLARRFAVYLGYRAITGSKR